MGAWFLTLAFQSESLSESLNKTLLLDKWEPELTCLWRWGARPPAWVSGILRWQRISVEVSGGMPPWRAGAPQGIPTQVINYVTHLGHAHPTKLPQREASVQMVERSNQPMSVFQSESVSFQLRDDMGQYIFLLIKYAPIHLLGQNFLKTNDAHISFFQKSEMYLEVNK